VDEWSAYGRQGAAGRGALRRAAEAMLRREQGC